MRRTLITALAATTTLALAGCAPEGGGPGAETSGSNVEDAINIGTFMDITSWNPAKADIGFDVAYLSAVYDPLVALDEESEPVPALATDWSYSEDHLTLTMQLREDVEFADGEQFDAAAAVANIDLLMEGITTQQAYRNVDSVETLDEHSIELHLSEKDDSLLYFMGLGRSWMASPEALDSDELDTHPVGSGPYSLEEDTSTVGEEYQFVKKGEHWDSERYPFQEVSMLPITDDTASMNAMLSGQLDVTYAMPGNIAVAEENGWNVSDVVAQSVGLQFVDRAGEQNEALGDVRVRRAINHAFDTEGILSSIGEGAGALTNQLFPAGGAINDPELDDIYGYDLDKAKELMAEAGYADGFTVHMPMAPPFQPYQAATEQSLAEIGIDVVWEDMSFADYHAKAATFGMFIAISTMEMEPTATVVRRIATEQWYNPEPALDLLPGTEEQVEQIGQASGQEQIDLIRDLNETLMDNAWWNIWYQANNVYFSVEGIEVNPITGPMFPPLRFIQPA